MKSTVWDISYFNYNEYDFLESQLQLMAFCDFFSDTLHCIPLHLNFAYPQEFYQIFERQ